MVNASGSGSSGRGFESHAGQTVLCTWVRHIYSPKVLVLVIPRKRWLRPNMTEKLFTGTLRIKQPTFLHASCLDVSRVCKQLLNKGYALNL